MQINPYLNFNGDCADAFRLYERVLGGRIETMMTHRVSPMADKVSPASLDRILHARLVVGDQVLMGSDAPPEYPQAAGNMYVSVQIDDVADAERIFGALAENGTVQMPFQATFWAKGFGMLIDRFGIPWIVNAGQAAAS